MEYLEQILKKTGWSSLISSVVFAILGIILINNPDETVKFVSWILGIMFILVGVYKIINYVADKGKYDFYDYNMAFGIIAILFGIITIAYSNQIGSIFRIIIGLWIMYSSIIRMNLAFKLRTINTNVWLYSLIIAFAMLLCGTYAVFNKGAIIVTVGIIILIYSILDIVESIIFLKNINDISK